MRLPEIGGDHLRGAGTPVDNGRLDDDLEVFLGISRHSRQFPGQIGVCDQFAT